MHDRVAGGPEEHCRGSDQRDRCIQSLQQITSPGNQWSAVSAGRVYMITYRDQKCSTNIAQMFPVVFKQQITSQNLWWVYCWVQFVTWNCPCFALLHIIIHWAFLWYDFYFYLQWSLGICSNPRSKQRPLWPWEAENSREAGGWTLGRSVPTFSTNVVMLVKLFSFDILNPTLIIIITVY